MGSTEEQFTSEMMRGIEEAKSLGYNATFFIRMVREFGALETAHKLLKSANAQEGLTSLWELGRLDLSLENQVLKPQYRLLFSRDELAEARKRLRSLGFTPVAHNAVSE